MTMWLKTICGRTPSFPLVSLNGVIDMGVVSISPDSGTTDIGDPQVRDILILGRVGVLDLIRSPVHSAELQIIHHCAQAGSISIIVASTVFILGFSRNQRHETVEPNLGFPVDKSMHITLGDIKSDGASLALIGILNADIVKFVSSPSLHLNSNRVSTVQDGKGIRARCMNGDVTCTVELVATLNSTIFVKEATAPASGSPTIPIITQADINEGVLGACGPDANGNTCATLAHIHHIALRQRYPAGRTLICGPLIAIGI